MLSLSWFRGCKGPQPSKSITAIKVLIESLEGAGPRGGGLDDGRTVLPQQGKGPMLGLYWFHGCKGLQPSKSITAIKVLIETLEGAGPSAPRWTLDALFYRNKARAQCWAYIGSAAARDCSPPSQ